MDPIIPKPFQAIKNLDLEFTGADGINYRINIYKGKETSKTLISIQAILASGIAFVDVGPYYETNVEDLMKSRVEDWRTEKKLEDEAELEFKKIKTAPIAKKAKKKAKKVAKLIKKAKKKK